MVGKNLMNDKISYTEEQQLQPEEMQQLKDKVFRQVILYLPCYLLLLGGAIIIFQNAPNAYKQVVDPGADLGDDEISRMFKLAPYISLFVFLMSTFFFGKIFFQSILPVLKDIKHKTKTLIFYKPEKTAMAFFNRYYLSTPLVKKRQVEINGEDFNSIPDSEDICLEIGKESLIVFGLKKGERKISCF